MIQIDSSLREYPAHSINLESSSLFWEREPGGRLLHSLENLGQCTPVLVESAGEGLRLVAGQRRVKGLLRLGQKVMACRVQTLSDWERGIVYLDSNCGQCMDDAKMVRALRYFHGCEGDLNHIAPYLDVESRSRQWQLLNQWMKLPRLWDDFLDQGRVPLVLARTLVRFRPESLQALEPFFAALSWSKNNAVHFVTWLWELSRSQKTAPEALLDALQLHAMLDQDLSPKDMMMRLVESLRTKRFPRLSTLEDGFRRKAAEVTAGSRWRLVQPDNFETGSVEFLTRIRSQQELLKSAQELVTLADHGVWNILEHAGDAK